MVSAMTLSINSQPMSSADNSSAFLPSVFQPINNVTTTTSGSMISTAKVTNYKSLNVITEPGVNTIVQFSQKLTIFHTKIWSVPPPIPPGTRLPLEDHCNQYECVSLDCGVDGQWQPLIVQTVSYATPEIYVEP